MALVDSRIRSFYMLRETLSIEQGSCQAIAGELGLRPVALRSTSPDVSKGDRHAFLFDLTQATPVIWRQARQTKPTPHPLQ